MVQPIANKPGIAQLPTDLPRRHVDEPIAQRRFDPARLHVATAALAALIQGGRGSNMDSAAEDAVKWADKLLEKLG